MGGAGLIILTETSAGPSQFVDFWARRYHYAGEADDLYTRNIAGPHTADSLRELFKWKIGHRLFEHSLPTVEKNFVGRIDDARKLSFDTDPRAFLREFGEGGAIWRIFWLHCWDQRFPIYDQHVHRAMRYIEDFEIDELEGKPDREKITNYLDRYIAFVHRFDGIDAREVDRAVWAFGKFIRNWNL